MKHGTRRVGILLGLAVLSAIPAGCIAVAAGAAAYGAYAYSEGSLDGVAGATLDRTWRATLATMNESGLSVISKTRDSASARIVARRADRTEIEINLTRRSADITGVSIRIGVFGDEAESRRIMNQIKAKV